MNDFPLQNRQSLPQNMPPLCIPAPPGGFLPAMGNFYVLFSQNLHSPEQSLRFDGMTSVSGLTVEQQSYIQVKHGGTYFITYGLTPGFGASKGDFAGIKIGENWITTSLQALSHNAVGINKSFLCDLQEGQILHMALQCKKPISLHAGFTSANLCLLQITAWE